MNISNFTINIKNNIKEMKNFFSTISKELVTALWVLLVLLLIICSYLKSEYSMEILSEFETYQVSSSDTIHIE